MPSSAIGMTRWVVVKSPRRVSRGADRPFSSGRPSTRTLVIRSTSWSRWRTRRRGDERPEGPPERRGHRGQLGQMGDGQGPEHGLALAGESDQDLTAIIAARRAAHEPTRHEAIDETDRAVVADLESLGQSADGRNSTGGQPLQSEERLMVLRLEAGDPSAAATPLEETADAVAELGERTILALAGAAAATG